jgi:hypothetical protein
VAALRPADHSQKGICAIFNRHILLVPIEFQIQEKYIQPGFTDYS